MSYVTEMKNRTGLLLQIRETFKLCRGLGTKALEKGCGVKKITALTLLINSNDAAEKNQRNIWKSHLSGEQIMQGIYADMSWGNVRNRRLPCHLIEMQIINL